MQQLLMHAVGVKTYEDLSSQSHDIVHKAPEQPGVILGFSLN